MSKELRTISDLNHYINSFNNFEKTRTAKKIPANFNLSFMRCFLKASHNIDKNFRIIHVAGTNGKGSLANILSILLSARGLNPGLFTSPHLIRINERFLCGHQQIDDETLLKQANRLISILPDIQANPTFFDFITALALFIFHEKNCDYVILETGLGGRLDSTNFANSSLALINTIDYDHKQWLGDTLAEIAMEKAGIIKENCPVIVGKQRISIYPLLKKAAQSKNATFFQYQKDFSISALKGTEQGISFNYSSRYRDSPMMITTPLLSLHQSRNIAMALFTLETLNIFPHREMVNTCLTEDSLPGRFQRVRRSPDIIVDGAHNPHAFQSLIFNLRRRYFSIDKRVLILSIRKDKDYSSMLSLTLGYFDEVIICKLGLFQEKDDNKEVLTLSRSLHPSVRYADSFKDAYHLIRPHLKEEDLLVISGSFYLAGEALEHFRMLN